MKENYQFVQGDRETISGTLIQNGSSIDLTGRSVTPVLLHEDDGRLDLVGSLSIDTPGDGSITLHLEPEDLGRVGTHALEFRITGGEDDPTTVPRDEPITITVRESSSLIRTVANTLSFGTLADLTINVPKSWQGYRIRDLGDPEDPQDATTRSWVNEQIGTISGSVTSVFGRSGDVTAQEGDYTASQVGAEPEGTVSTHASATQTHGVTAGSIASTDDITSEVSSHASDTSTHGVDTGSIASTEDVSTHASETQSHGVTSGSIASTDDITSAVDSHASNTQTHGVTSGSIASTDDITGALDQPKKIGSTAYADHPDFSTAQEAHDWAVSNGCTELKFGQNKNYGPLTVTESEFTIRGRASADTYRGSYIEDLVIDASRVRVIGVVGLQNNNAQAIRISGGFTSQLSNIGAAVDGSGSGGAGDILVEGSTAAAIVGGSRVNVTFDANTSQSLANNLIRSSVDDQGTNNQIGVVTPP